MTSMNRWILQDQSARSEVLKALETMAPLGPAFQAAFEALESVPLVGKYDIPGGFDGCVTITGASWTEGTRSGRPLLVVNLQWEGHPFVLALSEPGVHDLAACISEPALENLAGQALRLQTTKSVSRLGLEYTRYRWFKVEGDST